MKCSEVRLPTYLDCFAAQLGTMGVAGQRRLQRAAVVIVGAGGLGAAISSVLAAAGVGRLIIVDPQRLEPQDFNRYPLARAADIGRPKVDVLAALFEGRPHVSIVPVRGTAESIARTRFVDWDAQLLISASNTVASRLTVARLAARRGIPQISAAVSDGRERLGGTIVAWTPKAPDLACPGCFLSPSYRPERGESLVATVVATVGALASGLALRLLAVKSGAQAQALDGGNCLTIDLHQYAIDALRVMSRPDCPACGGANRSKGNAAHPA